MRKKRSGREVVLGQAVGDLVSRMGGDAYMAQAQVADVWDDTVGPEVARRTAIRGLRDGELLVDVDSPVWGNELSAMSGQISDALNQTLGQRLVRSMRFTVTPRVEHRNRELKEQDESLNLYRCEQTEKAQLDHHDTAEIERMAAEIQDPELREVAVRAALSDIARRRGEKA